MWLQFDTGDFNGAAITVGEEVDNSMDHILMPNNSDNGSDDNNKSVQNNNENIAIHRQEKKQNRLLIKNNLKIKEI